MLGLMEPPPPVNPVKHPLVTPSATPPPSRAHRATTATNFTITATRAASSIPPQYRRSHVSATPNPVQPHASSSTSTGREPLPDVPLDFHKERQASTLRLLDVWSQLAERYTRRLDEDDIVDIVTGKVIRDNGVLRNAKPMWFGYDQARERREEEDEAEEDEEGEGEEDYEQNDDDELDAFNASDHGDEDGEVLEIQGVDPVPPVTPQDPRDAADLREFLETERLRRDVLGNEPEYTLEEELFPPEDDGTDAYETAESEFNSDVFDVAEEDEREDTEEQDEHRMPHIQRRQEEGGSDSEDELNFNFELPLVGGAELDDPVTELSLSDSDDEVEIIDPPIPRKAVEAPASSRKTKLAPSDTIPHLQLHTPPLSRSSLLSTPTAVDLFSTPPPHDNEPGVDFTPEIPLAHSVSKPHLRSVLQSPAKGKIKQPSKPIPELSTKTASSKSTKSPKRLIPEVVITTRPPNSPLSKSKSKPSKLETSVVEAKSVTRKEKLTKNHSDQRQVSLSMPSKPPDLDRTSSKKSTTTTCAPSTSPTEPPTSSSSYAEQSHAMNEDRASSSPSPRKRKRSTARSMPPPDIIPKRFPESSVASGSKVQIQNFREATVSETESPIRSKDARKTVQQRSPRKRRSKSRRQSSSSGDDAGSNNDRNARQYSHYGSQPPPNLVYSYPPPPLYPPPPPPNMSQHPQHHQQHHPSRAFTPMPDPQTQYMVAQMMPQVMHYLSAFATAWNPAGMPPPPQQSHGPFTPTHHRMNPDFAYATPTHQHHPYPYAYHPDFSRATAPPDTPEQDLTSSSSASRSEGGRKRSLVHRSRSRGRTVSFKTSRSQTPEEHGGSESESNDEGDPYSSPVKRHTSGKQRSVLSVLKRKSTPAVSSDRGGRVGSSDKSKGKGKAREEVDEDEVPYDSQSEEEDVVVEEENDDDHGPPEPSGSRGRPVARGQTPGPALATPTATIAKHKQEGDAKSKKKKQQANQVGLARPSKSSKRS